MFKDLQESIDSAALPQMGSEVVVGVSGGADSTLAAMLMASLAEERCYILRFAHYRHGAGPADEVALKRVDALAAELGVTLVVSGVLEGQALARSADSEQMALRRMRYAWFRTLFTPNEHSQALVLGQNADDQAETVMMQVLKGRWLQGLAGIPEKRRLDAHSGPILHRPLLYVSRDAIRATLSKEGIPYCDDPANEDQAYDRVMMRRGLMAMAKDFRGESVLTALAAISTQAEDLVEAEEWMLPFLRERVELKDHLDGGVELNLNAQIPIFFWRTILRQILLELGLNTREATMARVERLRLAHMTKGAQELGAGVYYRRVHDQLRIWRK